MDVEAAGAVAPVNVVNEENTCPTSEQTNLAYEIEKIIDSKQNEAGQVLYKARWVAYTWIPSDCLQSYEHLIKDYLDKKIEEGGRIITQCNSENQTAEDTVQLMVNVDTTSQQNILLNSGVNDVTTSLDSSNVEVVKDKKDLFLMPVGGDSSNHESGNNAFLENSTMNCSKCNQRFFLKSNLEVHILFCDGKVQDNALLQNKLNALIPSLTTPQINNLDTTSPQSSNMEDIILSESQTYEYIPIDATVSEPCQVCLQRFPEGSEINSTLTDISQLLLNSRKKIISDKVEVYECEGCNRDFLFKHPSVIEESTAETIKKEKNVKPYKCSICNRSFDQENDMLEHEVKHTNTSSRYGCGSCNEKFVTRDALQKHYDDTSNQCQPRKCGICERIFVHANHLKRHMTIHAGVRPFICSICGHEFNQKSDLYRHEKRHTIDGKLTCSKCAYSFDNIEKLREHVKIHQKTDVKPSFTCERCGRKFGRKSHFQRHLSIHDGVRPHACDQCGKSFNQRSDLKRHVESHARREQKSNVGIGNKKTSNSSFYCTVCNKVFASRSAFLEHDLIHQKIMNTGAVY